MCLLRIQEVRNYGKNKGRKTHESSALRTFDLIGQVSHGACLISHTPPLAVEGKIIIQSIAEIVGCAQDYMRTEKDEINSAWELVVTEVVLSVWPLRIYILAWHYSRC